MSLHEITDAAESLAAAAETYRSKLRAITADPSLSHQGRQDARLKLRDTLADTIEQLTTTVPRLLAHLEQQHEDRLRDLSRESGANEAVARVGMALEQSHPGDLLEILTNDGDIAGLLALRQVAPSIAGRFTTIPDERIGFAETLRHDVDRALATISADGTPTATATADRFALDDARERYQAAVNYAVNPDATGQLGYALSDALVNA